ncbi:hypothetical protein EVAR_84604_1 [Eumeta japonica]|uniref:Uncharacterized protein n=1 Tax=Eumeta variegata TaxID=151549 RepID=A0A4C1V0D0_EUMVA|nr:hypothetical protein EVAR_84604_1 [Eumeta japonica]
MKINKFILSGSRLPRCRGTALPQSFHFGLREFKPSIAQCESGVDYDRIPSMRMATSDAEGLTYPPRHHVPRFKLTQEGPRSNNSAMSAVQNRGYAPGRARSVAVCIIKLRDFGGNRAAPPLQ